MTRAWALLVVSSEGQRENLEDYVEMARRDANAQGWTLERLDDFKDVASGRDGQRKTTLRLVAELTSTPPPLRPAWVWMRRTDRLGRGRATDSMLSLYAIHGLGVRIWDHDSGEVHLDTAEGELSAMLKAWFGRLDNEIRRGKAKAKYRARAEAGVVIGNRAPYGLAITPERTYVPKEPQAEAVRLAFSLAIQGHGCGHIGRRLQAVAPPPEYGRSQYPGKPVHWANNRVLRMLSNRAYVGPIVDEVTFARVQHARSERPQPARTSKHPWPLAGAIRCFCGRSMNGSLEDKKFRYYACRAFWIHGKRRRIVKAERLERQFTDLLARLALDPDEVTRMRESAHPVAPDLLEKALKEARRKLAEVEQRRAKVWTLFESDAIGSDVVSDRLRELDAERIGLGGRVADIEEQLAAAAQRTASLRDDMGMLARAVSTWLDATDEQRRMISAAVAEVVGGLYVAQDGTLAIGRPVDPTAQQKRPLAN